jgi:hypothetical protein
MSEHLREPLQSGPVTWAITAAAKHAKGFGADRDDSDKFEHLPSSPNIFAIRIPGFNIQKDKLVHTYRLRLRVPVICPNLTAKEKVQDISRREEAVGLSYLMSFA